jgi:hypothetical protein
MLPGCQSGRLPLSRRVDLSKWWTGTELPTYCNFWCAPHVFFFFFFDFFFESTYIPLVVARGTGRSCAISASLLTYVSRANQPVLTKNYRRDLLQAYEGCSPC